MEEQPEHSTAVLQYPIEIDLVAKTLAIFKSYQVLAHADSKPAPVTHEIPRQARWTCSFDLPDWTTVNPLRLFPF